MTMSVVWTAMVAVAVLCGAATGRTEQVAAGAMEGAKAAVELCLGMGGTLCLWTGVMEVMRRSGLSQKLGRLLGPVLRRLYPGEDKRTLDHVAANASANLLGLGNAATPLGIEAAKGMARRSGGRAGDNLCMLVVCNTASVQLLPTTVAAVRGAAGSANPFDILPAVWLASALSVLAGIGAVKLLGRVWRFAE
ncbi:MAG: spore maturation protein A [Ruminococcaceae bacterium]|nr:spore maturation protein A [Oscillospiraceae bacterium]